MELLWHCLKREGIFTKSQRRRRRRRPTDREAIDGAARRGAARRAVFSRMYCKRHLNVVFSHAVEWLTSGRPVMRDCFSEMFFFSAAFSPSRRVASRRISFLQYFDASLSAISAALSSTRTSQNITALSRESKAGLESGTIYRHIHKHIFRHRRHRREAVRRGTF